MDPSGLKLGELIEEGRNPQRDAIHVAVVPAVAGERLGPGMPVVIVDGKACLSPTKERVGVVDPFLHVLTEKGQRFWLYLNPGTITGLRHEWTHPAFPLVGSATEAERVESEAWLRDFIGPCEAYGQKFEDVIRKFAIDHEGTVFGREEHEAPAEFWDHLERLTGARLTHAQRENAYFSCTC